ncbi:MAG: hypothetical protein GXY38_08490 [Planctomycetes bacterium]|nr:hypothetical protein [Planctomycetota bacterium]
MPNKEWSAAPEKGGAVEEAKHKAHEEGRRIKQTASSALDEGKQRAGELAQENKDRICESLDSAASALHAACDRLRAENHGTMAQWGEAAADELSRFSQGLRDREPGGMLNEVEEFGKRRPEAFLAAALVGGIAIGRIIRSTASRQQQSSHVQAA